MKNIKDAVEFAGEALKSIDNIQAVDVNDFIFTRIQSRMETKAQASKKARAKFLYRLSGVLLLFVMLNATSYFVLKPVKSQTTTIKHKTTSGISAFADDYQLEQGSYNY